VELCFGIGLNKKIKNLNDCFCLLFAMHLLCVFSFIDFLHEDDCQSQDTTTPSHDAECPACHFKLGAQAEQPNMSVTLESAVRFHEPILFETYSFLGISPRHRIYLHAPPAA